MPPSTRALVSVAIVPATIIGLAALQPAGVSAAPLPSALGRLPIEVAGPDAWVIPIERGGDAEATAQREPVAPSLPAVPSLGEFAAGPGRSDIVMSAVSVLDAIRESDVTNYQAAVRQLAAGVSASTGLDIDQLASIWQTTSVTRMTALAAALSQVGVNYRYASSTPNGSFDCSGLVSWAWSQAGVELPHQSRSIINAVPQRPLADVLPGDVLYYPGHISLALGIGDSFVDAPGRGKTVRVEARHSVRAARRLLVGSPE